MSDDAELDRVVTATLEKLDGYLNDYQEYKRMRGEPISRRELLDQVEQSLFSPERVAIRKSAAEENAIDPAFIVSVWRECIRRLRTRADN